MKTALTRPNTDEPRARERGAALVTMMLISTLLLGAGAALLAASNIGATNSIDSTNEVQAYYAAEAGLQAALNVLRENVELVNGVAPARRPTFRNVVTLADGTVSNRNMDEWLAYDPDSQMVILDDSAWTRFAAYRLNIIPNDPNDPTSLNVQATGFGPRGATKQLQMIIIRSTFNFDAPATITLVGDSNGLPLSNFSLGNSSVRGYTGVDQAGAEVTIPTFGFTQVANRTVVNATTFDCPTNECEKNRAAVNDDPRTSTVTNTQLPAWLQSADNSREFLNELQVFAEEQNRYYSGGSTPSALGSAADPRMTFVDGDYSLSGSGGGLLVVTGQLTLRGNFSWNGLILVLGQGSILRNGGGDGTISGALVVAAFDPDDPDSEFLSTSFQTNGGGSSTIEYNSDDVNNSLTTLGFRVAGVREW